MYDLSQGLDTVVTAGKESAPLVFIKGNNDFKVSGYIGPKDFQLLKSNR